MWWTLPNQKIATSALHGRNSGSFVPSVATANSLNGALAGSMQSHIGAYMAQGFSFDAVSVRDMSDPTLAEFRSNNGGLAVGNLSPALPADVSAVLTGMTVTRGRGARGRIYISGWGSAADSGTGVIASVVQTALNALGVDWKANLLAASLVACVAKPHRQEYNGLSGALHPDRPATTVDVSAYLCRDTEWDTQRRRGK